MQNFISAWEKIPIRSQQFLMIMRISTFSFTILLCSTHLLPASPSFGQNLLEKKITLEVKNSSLRNTLNRIGQISGLRMAYALEQVTPYRHINLSKDSRSVEQTLKEVLEGTGLTFKEGAGNTILIIRPQVKKPETNTFPSSRLPDSASELRLTVREIRGKVTDENGEGLPGVSILIKGTQRGTTTDAGGDFTLNIPDEDIILIVSYVGYVSQEVKPGNLSEVYVSLLQDQKSLKEIVVVGYGTQSKSLITSSISQLNTKVLENAAMANVGAALQGAIPGLRVINASGQPGSAPNILLRGGASINNPGSPLVVVDGLVRTMNDINPADIKSISVLKDAASTAVYGARANNGVILITTHKGVAGSAKVTYHGKIGVNSLRPDYKYLNARDMIYYNRIAMRKMNEALAQGGQSPVNPNSIAPWGYRTGNSPLYSMDKLDGTNRDQLPRLLSEGWQWMLDPYYEGDTLIFKDYGTEMYDNAFSMNARTQDHHLSFTGGNDKASFASSVGYYSEDGLLINTLYERFSTRLSGAYKVKKNLEVSGNFDFSNSKRPPMSSSESLTFFRSLSVPPTFKPFDDNGNPSSGAGQWDSNPLYWQDKFIRKNGIRRTTFGAGARWDIFKDLALNAKMNIYYVDETNESFNKETKFVLNPLPNSNRDASASYNQTLQQQHNITLDYIRNFNGHNLGVTAGAEYFNSSAFSLSAAGRKAATDYIYTLNSAVERTSISSSRSELRILSGFGRFSYDFNRKYLLTAVLRYDGISSLADNRWGAFPGVSLGWNIHEESFFSNSDISRYISSVKPRASYGVNGNIAGVGNYEVQGAYAIQSNYHQEAGFLNTVVPNRNLLWEKSVSSQFGVDIGFLNNRVTFSADFFSRETKQLLTNLTLPSHTGFSSFRTNLGNLRNSGYEFDINASVLQRTDLTVDLGFNASFVRNKIIKLPFNGNEKNRQGGSQVFDPVSQKVIWVGGLQEGETIGNMYAYRQERILRDWEDVNQSVANRYDEVAQLYGPAAYAALENKTGKYPIEPGDVLWADLDGNGIINTLDRVYTGNIYPDWTGGFNVSVSYKKFSLYTRMDYALGHTIYNDKLARSLGQYVGAVNNYDLVKKQWSPDNPDGEYPQMYWGDSPKRNYQRSGLHFETQDDHNSKFYEKGDYLSLRELTLSYTLPGNLLSRIGVSSLRLNLTGQNLAYFTRYTGNAPELGGLDNGRFPMPRTFVLGLLISF